MSDGCGWARLPYINSFNLHSNPLAPILSFLYRRENYSREMKKVFKVTKQIELGFKLGQPVFHCAFLTLSNPSLGIRDLPDRVLSSFPSNVALAWVWWCYYKWTFLFSKFQVTTFAEISHQLPSFNRVWQHCCIISKKSERFYIRMSLHPTGIRPKQERCLLRHQTGQKELRVSTWRSTNHRAKNHS